MSKVLKQKLTVDVAIIGSGPAGIAAAITLKKAGIDNIVVLEREDQAGGIPRHCGHIAFGFKKYKRILTGPQYAQKNIEEALSLGIIIKLKTTVTALGKEGVLSVVSSADGGYEIKAKRVIIATGTREKPRSARFVSGDRVLGICNTGALQGMVYLKNKIPFKRPIIVGTEIVSFSSLLTCRKGGIKPVAMLEKNSRASVRWPIYYGASFFGTRLLLGTSIQKIQGKDRVESVVVKNGDKKLETIECDGVLFTGEFTPESSLVRMSHLEFDASTFSPIVNDQGCCSDSIYYAAGNVHQLNAEEGRNPFFYNAGHAPNAVNISGMCWNEGINVANNIMSDLGACPRTKIETKISE